jgi:NADPH-dependent 2,4-dienoyl-CoA reductase/sulfur reductase-like enzyme
METCVVLGAGQAGAYAAIGMRRAGYAGRILLVGDDGELPYDRTPLSKAYMLGLQDEPTLFFSPDTYAELEIELMLGRYDDGIDQQQARLLLGNGDRLSYDRLVLATGSSPRPLTVSGGEVAHTLRTRRDAERLKQLLRPGVRLVCVGAGVVGLEIAAAAASRGCIVTVLELAESVMSRSLLPPLAEIIAREHRRAGVEIMLGVQLEAIDNRHALLADGRSIDADVVVAGIGVLRNVAIAREAGIAVERGILVDTAGRTSAGNVFAAGEVAEIFSPRLGHHLVLESWRHAQDHGTAVGRSIAGQGQAYDEIPWFWTDQYGQNFQVAGDAGSGAQIVYRGSPDSEAYSVFLLDGEQRVTGAFGVNAGRDVAAAMRLMRRNTPVHATLIADTSLSPQRLVSVSAVADQSA